MKALRIRGLIPIGVILVGALLLGQGIVPGAVAAASPKIKPASTASDLAQSITVVGRGVVVTKPDAAEVTVGVEIVADGVDVASDESSATLEDIV